MTESRVSALLAQIREAAQDIADYIEGMTLAGFLAYKRTKQAVVLNILIIGETVTKLMAAEPAFVASNMDIPWLSIRGMRNRIAHGYFDIDFQIVWDTASIAIPDLLRRMQKLKQDH